VVLWSKVRNGQERSGNVRKGQERKGKERKGQERSGKVRKGQERTGKVRKDQELQQGSNAAIGKLIWVCVLEISSEKCQILTVWFG
jgi:hypothetical protein